MLDWEPCGKPADCFKKNEGKVVVDTIFDPKSLNTSLVCDEHLPCDRTYGDLSTPLSYKINFALKKGAEMDVYIGWSEFVTASVPEPTSIALIFIGLLVLYHVRTRKYQFKGVGFG